MRAGAVAMVLAALGGTVVAGHGMSSRAEASRDLGTAPEPAVGLGAVAALGRLEPRNGVVRVAGPSEPAVVVAELLVEVGDEVRENEPIARLDTFPVREAEVARRRAELRDARSGERRFRQLHAEGVVSEAERDAFETRAAIAAANLRRAEAALAMAVVRAPADARVLEVHARAGERVGEEGILELGRTSEMRAIAEVYETDLGRVGLGDRAVVTAPALPGELSGRVARIRPKVARQALLHADPVARTDARVVEVEIRLDDGSAAAGLTNLQVDVSIFP